MFVRTVTVFVLVVLSSWPCGNTFVETRFVPRRPPWLGVTERIDIGAFLLWVAVLARLLLRAHAATDVRARELPRFGLTRRLKGGSHA